MWMKRWMRQEGKGRGGEGEGSDARWIDKK
jgi:hypothetical protein